MNSINCNPVAADVASSLNSHYGRLATSVKRMSTGLRINSAADDAAGLAIRELMRADVAALNQGVRNANDAISMIQVADGALGIIDEKLIRMKELAEQAATGTYNSTQRLMIHSEFTAMAEEIDRIARATDFNGIKLLDGSLSGQHNGKGLNATGAMKVHFGAANDSAEDYYYVQIDDCTTAGLGLRDKGTKDNAPAAKSGSLKKDAARITGEGSFEASGMVKPPLNNWYPLPSQVVEDLAMTDGYVGNVQDVIPKQGVWHLGLAPNFRSGMDVEQNFMFIIPKGTKNFVFNQFGCPRGGGGDNDIQLFTKGGVHLAGTPLSDYVFHPPAFPGQPTVKPTDINSNSAMLGFTSADYDDSVLNTGPAVWDGGKTLNYSQYNGMTIGYSGDGERQDAHPEDGVIDGPNDFEILTIDETTEDLIVWLPGTASAYFQYYIDYQGNPPAPPGPPDPPNPPGPNPPVPQGDLVSIDTQEQAQQALREIDDAIVAKDKVRAHLGAMQNRLENTATNLASQAENLQAAESRISDADIAREMTNFVRNQILTQSAVAMLSQANSYPHMLSVLITG